MSTGPLVIDKYIPSEGINYIFSDFRNIDIISRPIRTGFQKAIYAICKRMGLMNSVIQSGYNKRQTLGNIKYGEFSDSKIRTYTDKGFIYNFDGADTYAINGVSGGFTQLLGDTDSLIRTTSNELGKGQEFTTGTGDQVLLNVMFNLKRVGILGVATNISARLYLSSNKTVELISSTTTLSGNNLTTGYVAYNFLFPNYSLLPSTSYYVVVEATNTDATNYVAVQSKSANPFAGGEMYARSIALVDTVVSTFDLYFNIGITKGFTYNGLTYDEDIVNISYLGGGIFGTATVQSYDSVTRTVTVNAAVITAGHVTKLAYISAGAVGGLRQVRQVESTASATTFVVDTTFSPNLTLGDTITFYNKRITQLRYPQLRGGVSSPQSDNLIARDIEGNIMQWSFPKSRKLVSFDSRLASLSLDGSAILFTDSVSLERFVAIPPVYLGNDKALNMAVFSGFLFVFFANKIGVVKKTQFTDSVNNNVTTIYQYQDILNTGLYSYQSYLSNGGELYIVGNDKIMYSVNLQNATADEVSAKITPQSFVIKNYLEKFVGGEVQMHYDQGVIYLLYRKDDTHSEVYRYDKNYKSRLPDTYPYGLGFMKILKSIGNTRYTNVANSFVSMTGLLDLTNNIDQYFSMDGPVENFMNLGVLDQIKMKLGFDGSPIGGKVRVTTGGTKKTRKVFDIESIPVVQNINAESIIDGTVGSSVVGSELVGGETNVNNTNLINKYSEYIDASINTSNFGEGGVYTIEVRNNTKNQLICAGIQTNINVSSTSDKYNKTVLNIIEDTTTFT